MITTALYVAAACVLVVGALLDPPKFSVIRCIALAMALVVLAQVVGVR